jgi:hypothetical protein
MAGAVFDRELSTARKGRIRFDVARRTDDDEIRRLLRENPMPGQITISLEREPHYFADAELPGETKQTIVARDGERLVCVGCCTIRQRFVGGEARRVGYLGGLRLDAKCAGRFDIVRRGYEFFRELQTEAPADFYFTSIAADNERARKLLERGVTKMPRYESLGEFVTLLLPASFSRWFGKASVSRMNQDAATPPDMVELATRLNEHNQAYQFAPCWSGAELGALGRLGLKSSDFCGVCEKRRLLGFGALWDQRNFKQTVIRGYSHRLAAARPLINSIARIIGAPQLPAVGRELANAFGSHLAIRPEEPNALIQLVANLRAMACERGLEFLTLGYAASDPRLTTVCGNFRYRHYRSRLYVVHWPEIGGATRKLDARMLAPEVALL